MALENMTRIQTAAAYKLNVSWVPSYSLNDKVWFVLLLIQFNYYVHPALALCLCVICLMPLANLHQFLIFALPFSV